MGTPSERNRGIIYTFYSYKGGVGRTMALANVAALLAKWGHSVLVVDWDLEAPGIERFFLTGRKNLTEERRHTPGIADLISAKADKGEVDWAKCLLEAYPFGPSTPVTIISAGKTDDNYIAKVQSLNFLQLFRESELGTYIEQLRNEWIQQFEFVLVDSRTGITDVGGICTIHLPDVLVLLFTTSDSSLNGVLDVLARARTEQALLPFDRRRLVALPVAARDESRTELARSLQWKRLFAERLAEYYRDWLPTDKTASDALEVLRIPHIPYWSFGETLPVVEEGTSDPTSLGFAYGFLARLVATKLDWNRAFSGELLAEPVRRSERPWNEGWLEKHRKIAIPALQKAGWNGFMEIRFFSPNLQVHRLQDELLAAARNSAIHSFGWPIGIVLDADEFRPRPTGEGIVAEVNTEHSYDYWTLTNRLDFYSLMSLFEDFRTKERNTLFVDTQIVRTAEALSYCSRLLRSLSADENSKVRFGLRYRGLKGRRLAVASPNRAWMHKYENLSEDEVETEVTFLLGEFETRLLELVEQLCTPLFLLFDFNRIAGSVYEDIVANFRQGKIF